MSGWSLLVIVVFLGVCKVGYDFWIVLNSSTIYPDHDNPPEEDE